LLTLCSGILQARCDTLVKEREAVTTIMEQKIKVLVQNVAQSVSEVVSTNPQVGGTAPGVALTKDLQALQRLVGASIAALKNAASASAGGGTPSSRPAPRATSGAPNPSAVSTPSYVPPHASSNGQLPLTASGASARPPVPMVPKPNGYAGSFAASTPLPLPAYPGGSGAGGYPSNSSYATPNGNQGSVLMARSSAGANGNTAWGSKDESYSSGDVYRSASADRR
jgi:hypothetical protein